MYNCKKTTHYTTVWDSYEREYFLLYRVHLWTLSWIENYTLMKTETLWNPYERFLLIHIFSGTYLRRNKVVVQASVAGLFLFGRNKRYNGRKSY